MNVLMMKFIELVGGYLEVRMFARNSSSLIIPGGRGFNVLENSKEGEHIKKTGRSNEKFHYFL